MREFEGDEIDRGLSRRGCLRGLAALSGAAALSFTAPGWAATVGRLPKTRELSLHSLHTGEKVRATYLRDGRYDASALYDIDQLLRDWRRDEVVEMDRKLLDLLYVLRHRLGSSAPFEVVSGYRSPATNAALANAGTGVAKRSLHMLGRAIDIRLPGRSIKTVHRAALDLKAGGVGLYSKSQFIHIDTGKVRNWGA